MPTGSDNGPDAKRNNSAFELPDFPGEDFLAHTGTQWLETARAKLAGCKLLAVAERQPPPANNAIIDVDLAQLPLLPPGHRDYERRLEARTKVVAQNRANDQKRFMNTMDAWTELYAMIKACTEKNAPVLSRNLMELCDLAKTQGVTGGYFDGPRAWAIVEHRVTGGERSETDKDFYRTAERLQRATQLANS